MFTFYKPSKALLFEAAHPVLQRTRCISQQARNFWTAHSLGNQQHPMQAVIVARLL